MRIVYWKGKVVTSEGFAGCRGGKFPESGSGREPIKHGVMLKIIQEDETHKQMMKIERALNERRMMMMCCVGGALFTFPPLRQEHTCALVASTSTSSESFNLLLFEPPVPPVHQTFPPQFKSYFFQAHVATCPYQFEYYFVKHLGHLPYNVKNWKDTNKMYCFGSHTHLSEQHLLSHLLFLCLNIQLLVKINLLTCLKMIYWPSLLVWRWFIDQVLVLVKGLVRHSRNCIMHQVYQPALIHIFLLQKSYLFTFLFYFDNFFSLWMKAEQAEKLEPFCWVL